MTAIIKLVSKNQFCEVWRLGAWRYVKYFDGTGWWRFERKWTRKGELCNPKN